MMDRDFYAYRVFKEGDGFAGRITRLTPADLPQGEVLIKVSHSSLNYKDALSATGNPGVTRKFPHTPGIDAAGVVEESASPSFKPGDAVLVTGYDLGMDTDGGFAQYCRVPASWVVPLPSGLSAEEAMMLGTAGFTAGLGVWHLVESGIKPEMGPVLVTGASGGVGSIAVSILAKLGYYVVAGSLPEDAGYLSGLGARECLDRAELQTESPKAMLPERWAAAYDTVGGRTLENVIKGTKYMGSVACCGMVGGGALSLTVFPFILRGVRLLGVDSVQCPMGPRIEVWKKLAGEWKPSCLKEISSTVNLDGVGERIAMILRGGVKGRTVVLPETKGV